MTRNTNKVLHAKSYIFILHYTRSLKRTIRSIQSINRSYPKLAVTYAFRIYISLSVTNYLLILSPWKSKSTNPFLNLASQLHNLSLIISITNPLKEGLDGSWVLTSLSSLCLHSCLVQSLSDHDGAIDDVGDTGEVLWLETTSGHGWSTHSQSTRLQRRHITWDSVLVRGNTNKLKDTLHTRTIHTLWLQVNKDKVVVRSTRNDGVSKTALLLGVTKTLSERLGVDKDLLLVGLELWSLCLLERNCQSGDGVVMWSSLVAWENRGVDFILKIIHDLLSSLLVRRTNTLAVEDHGATRATERFVSGGGDDVGEWEWRWDDTRGDETGDVGHVGEEVGTSLVGHLAELGVVQETGVCGGTSHDELWAVEHGELLELDIVDQAGLLVKAVWEGLKVFGDGGDLLGWGLVAVGQVAAMWKVESHESVVDVEDGGVCLEVGWGAGVWLDVDAPFCWVELEGLESALLAQGLGLIYELVSSVVSRTWVTLRVLVCDVKSVSFL